jgi:hypothetical protein
VRQTNLYGNYIASYPFGKEELTLNRDDTFVQTVAVNGQAAAVSRGSWRFDSVHSQVKFYGLMRVADGFGQLRDDWRTIPPEPTGALPAELLWFRVELGGGDYTYVKQ